MIHVNVMFYHSIQRICVSENRGTIISAGYTYFYIGKQIDRAGGISSERHTVARSGRLRTRRVV